MDHKKLTNPPGILLISENPRYKIVDRKVIEEGGPEPQKSIEAMIDLLLNREFPKDRDSVRTQNDEGRLPGE